MEKLTKKLKNGLYPEFETKFDGTTQIFLIGSTRWGAATEEKYEASEKLISNYTVQNDLFELWVGYDVSGFDYWMNNMNEPNYCSITVEAVKPVEKMTEEEIEKVAQAINEADNFFEENLTDYYDADEERNSDDEE